MGKPKKKATKRRPPRRSDPLTAEDIAAIKRGEIETTVEFAGTRLPVMPPFESMTKGEILTWVTRAQRGTPIAHIALGPPVHWKVMHQALRAPRVTEPAPSRPRGAPLKHPAMLERLRADLVAHETHTPPQRAARLGLSVSTVRRYLQRLAVQPR